MKIKKTKQISENMQADLMLIEKIQPQGGISFKDETIINTGNGYECCIHVYELPESLDDHWLASITNLLNTVVTIDVSTDNVAEVKKNLNKSMKEQNQRYLNAENYGDKSDAATRFAEMKMMMDELNSLSEVVKLLDIRIFISDRKWVKLEDKKKNIMDSLESMGYKSAVFLNENRNEWLSMYRSYKKQQEETFVVPGLPLTSTIVAAGNPFHFSCLEDPYGFYLGNTPTGGNVIFDMFIKTLTRLYYNALCIGTMGSGKSTILKKLFEDRAIRGDFVRAFDVSGEFTTLTNQYGGKIVKPDGSDDSGRLNSLEILRSGENENVNFARHLSKVITMFKFLKPEADQNTITMYTKLLRGLYEEFDLLPTKDGIEHKVTGLSPDKYPIYSDLLKYIDQTMKKIINSSDSLNEVELELAKKDIVIQSEIRDTIENIVKTYGSMFNGYSTIYNMIDEQIITFNLQDLKNMSPEIFDAMLFNMLSLCWDNCVTNGTIMKEKYESGEISLEEVIHFLILIDESHTWVNATKLQALSLLLTYMREARKFFGGIFMASQSLRDYVPEGSSDIAINQIKTLFELTQYKFIFHQDSNVLSLIDQVFKDVLTQSQRDRIPKLGQGENILCISGDINLEFKVFLTKDEEKIFAGGA